MKTKIFLITAIFFSLAAFPVMAMQEGDKDMQSGGDMSQGGHGMQMDHAAMGGTFKYDASEGGIDARFQVMSLASMNMTSDQGDTHHIMVNFKDAGDGAPIKDIIGKIKVIAPDKSEQEGVLKNYNGILAANFTFKDPGKYGVICLVKYHDKKHVFKFWYPYMQ